MHFLGNSGRQSPLYKRIRRFSAITVLFRQILRTSLSPFQRLAVFPEIFCCSHGWGSLRRRKFWSSASASLTTKTPSSANFIAGRTTLFSGTPYFQRQREPRHGTRRTGCQMRRQRLFGPRYSCSSRNISRGRASRRHFTKIDRRGSAIFSVRSSINSRRPDFRLADA